MWYSGGSRGGARVALVSLLFLDQTEARRAKKQFFFETAPLLSRGVDDRPTSLTHVTVEKLKVYSRPTSV